MDALELKYLPKMWFDCFSGKINSLLELELILYHKFAKSPDTGLNFRRFYRLLEPLFVNLSHKYFSQLSGNVFENRFFQIAQKKKLNNFLASSQKIIVLKGPIDLAHGKVLEKQISNLNELEKSKVRLLLIDYVPSSKFVVNNTLGVPIFALGDITALKTGMQ